MISGNDISDKDIFVVSILGLMTVSIFFVLIYSMVSFTIDNIRTKPKPPAPISPFAKEMEEACKHASTYDQVTYCATEFLYNKLEGKCK